MNNTRFPAMPLDNRAQPISNKVEIQSIMPVKLMIALGGIFISAMMSGLNSRVGSLGLIDIRGTLGLGVDGASWIQTAYAMGELLVMPFASWFAITFSVRRYHNIMAGLCALIALVLPFVTNGNLFIGLRFLQGMTAGALVPILMMAALKFLPLKIRLHGLALYAMTATFAPNISMWLTGFWLDSIHDWRWLFWQVIPLCLIAMWMVGYGLPREAVKTQRFKSINGIAMLIGVTAMVAIAMGFDQAGRLNWFESPFIVAALLVGAVLLCTYFWLEWHHLEPFIKPQLLLRRNLFIGTAILLLLLVVLMSGTMLPSIYLAKVQDYRVWQSASLGLWIGLPQLVLGSVVALLLYRKWVDARMVLSVGLALIAGACFVASKLNHDWNYQQFMVSQLLQALGQPMAVVPILFLMTGALDPSEGPFFSGAINTFRVFGSLIGGAVVSEILTLRSNFHSEVLLDHATLNSASVSTSVSSNQLAGWVSQQSLVLSIIDVYQLLGGLSLCLIPLALMMKRVSAPVVNE